MNIQMNVYLNIIVACGELLDFYNLSVGSILKYVLPQIGSCSLHHNYVLKELVRVLLKDL